MIIFVSRRKRYTDSHFKWAFYLSSALLNKLAKCFCSFFAEIMISPAFIYSLFCYEDCFPHFRCHRYFWKKNNISWWVQMTPQPLCQKLLSIPLSFKFAEEKIFVLQTIVCYFCFSILTVFDGKMTSQDWQQTFISFKGVINRKFWNCMTT